jgi:choline dehydrogenase-like flavoprotein
VTRARWSSSPRSGRVETRGADYVVVGAGSAGAALAGRLAERGADVLLVEAGRDWRSEEAPHDLRFPPPDVFAWKVGGRVPSEFLDPGVRVRRWPGGDPEPYVRGRGLGGTSSINGLVVIRPPLEEFDEWAAAGCTGWGSADVLPFFARLEDDLEYGDEPYHGRGGPTPIVRREGAAWGAGDRLLADAALAAGHAWEPDHNKPGAFGVSRTALNIRLGVRWTTNDGYLEPHRYRGNLRILGEASVDRVLVTEGRATGVVVRRGGEELVLEAGTVVLAAGAASSPGILQRSGVGPRPLLDRLGIPVAADLPVGVGMQDHLGLWLALELAESEGQARNGARGNVTLRYTSGAPDFDSGDLLIVAANPLADDPGTVAMGVKLGQVHSRGSFEIASADPGAPADIAIGLLSDPRDRVLARRAVRDAVAMFSAQAVAGRVRAIRDREGREIDPGMSDAEIDALMREVARDTSHLSSGARMGDPASATTVVDPRGRVLGIDGLVVADLSICPWVPRANTHLTAIMIGERLADLLLPPAPAVG